jgi:hypothetical protein
MRYLTLVLALLFFCGGCASTGDFVGAPKKVLIISCTDLGRTVAAVAHKAEHIQKCEALFPNYKSIPGSDLGVGSLIRYEFFFGFGAKVLRVSSDGEYWAMGHGALRVNGDIKKLIEDLKSKK